MIDGWLSLRAEGPHWVTAWHQKLGFEIVSERPDVGSIAIGTKDKGRVMVLLPGEKIGHPDRFEIHFAVPDVDAECEHLKRAGIQFSEALERSAMAMAARVYPRPCRSHT
jgi:hypothetical protein